MIANTDTKHYLELTDSVYRFMPSVLTPEDAKRIHGFNERISVENYEKTINYFYHLMINADAANLDTEKPHSELWYLSFVFNTRSRLVTLRAESPSIFLENISRKIKGDSSRRRYCLGEQWETGTIFRASFRSWSQRFRVRLWMSTTCSAEDCVSAVLS